MAETKINYVDKVWNPVTGCTKCSPGCDNCYAEYLHNMRHRAYTENKKVPKQYAKPFSDIQLLHHRLDDPLHWKKPCRILCCSMGDLFHEDVPADFEIDAIDTAHAAYWHSIFFLTKRVEKMSKIIKVYYSNLRASIPEEDYEKTIPIPNIHLGVTVCNQKEADEKIPILMQIPAAHRWLSIEPMLEGFGIQRYLWRWIRDSYKLWGKIHWVVIGCESGAKRRKCEIAWIKEIVRQCNTANIPVFVKQLEYNGKVIHGPEDAGWPDWAERKLR